MLQSREVHSLAADVEIVPSNYFAPLDLEAIYGRSAPLEVDLGCGDGTFLAQIAEANRERDFLGIERLWEGCRAPSEKLIRVN
jgi:tRNA (guanine-N7-)-methyltransferase